MTIELRTLYVLLLFGSAGVVLLLSLITWQRRNYLGKTGAYFILCLLLLLIYNLGYAIELLQDTLFEMMFWVRFENWGIQLLAPTWLLFVLSLSGNERWITSKRAAILYGIAISLLITSQTLGGANLFHLNPRVDTSGGFPTFQYDRTWINYLALAYYSLCIFSSIVLFTQMLFRLPSPFRSQIIIFGIASLLPWVGGTLYILEITPHYLDTTPFTLTLSILIFTVGFFRFGTLDIVPLARDLIFEGMSDAALVLDYQNRVLDFNPRLKEILPEANTTIIGKPAKAVFQLYPTLVEMIVSDSVEPIEFAVTNREGQFTYQAKQSPLYKIGQLHPIGKIIMLHDITPLKELMKKLEILATTDSLTQLCNRHHFQELARLELYRVERYGGDLSLITFDLDNFKTVNDRYGHAAGDATLIHIAQLCRRLTRQSDIVARLGGEEFAILLPQTPLRAAICSAEKLRLAFEQHAVEYEGQSFTVTASFGVSSRSLPERGSYDELLRAADRALYRAKEAGRNRVWADDA